MKNIFFVLLLFSVEIHAQTDNYVVDALVNPKQQEQIITVGGLNADIHGFTNEAIQLAVDALSDNGGTVMLNEGQFEIKAPVRLSSNINLIGSGTETILRRIDGYNSNFIIDADFGELKITVEDASGFDVGMSIQVTDNKWSSCWNVSTAVITDIVDNIIYFDTYLIRDYNSEDNGKVTNAGSCVSINGEENISLSNFTIDGNKSKNDILDGCNGGGIAILKSKDVIIENIHVKDFNGEGITWQITENITVRDCEISGCTNMGLHPGSGSPNTRIENNNSHHNKVGLFICWRVSHSLVKANQFHNNSDCGISTGHKDTDVVFDNNHIYENGTDGVYFRGEDSKNSPHRNSFINNTIENNGALNGGYGFNINGNATDLVLKDNII
ncbi:MAG: right-handed parallel beta-helix repeat-containing protein, partial [Bacteroidales bacterium]|nr:right-handed parallel beta-helix repeat-containing protein [Bacteroidales bacterium]